MSAKAMHTPGPWSAEEIRHDYDQVVRGPDRGPVALAQLAGYGKQTGQANARLIAAAPDLLEAGDALYKAIGNWEKPEQGFLTPEMIAAGKKWCAALAKATTP